MAKTFTPFCAPLAVAFALVVAQPARSQEIPSPEEILGFVPGTDSLLATWSQIGSYLEVLATASNRVRLDTIGTSTLGRPLLLLRITSPSNHDRVQDILRVQGLISHPEQLTPAARASALARQPVVVLINNNIHSTEIASSLFAVELAHRLATWHEYERLLDSLVVLIIPSTNPDGLDTVVRWYRDYKGTDFEGGPLPWLYHPYAGHDNNRDWFMLSQRETRAVTRQLYHKWFPEVVWDLHQMGQDGARFFLPPFANPINPNIDPILVAATNMVGATMATAIQDSGLTGVSHGTQFDLWWHGGFRTVPARHNMIGILSEAASARLASPVFIERDARTQRVATMFRPSTWKGGWWRIGDIIRYELLAADGLLRLLYDQRESFIRRFILLGERAIRDGRDTPPAAFLIPPTQRDRHSNRVLQQLLLDGGIDLELATSEFSAGGDSYPAGTVIIPLDQPFRSHVKDLLEIQIYPVSEDSLARPYDSAGWTLPLQMGLEVITVDGRFDYSAIPIDAPAIGTGQIVGTGPLLVLRNTSNAESRATAAALSSGATAWLTDTSLTIAGVTLPAGSIVLKGGKADSIVSDLAIRFSFDAFRLSRLPQPQQVINRLPRIGIYSGHTANMDEGWTRWTFESNAIPYRSVSTAQIISGDIIRDFDVILLPSADSTQLLEGSSTSRVPEEFSGGLGPIGVAKIREFVELGGILVALGATSNFVIDQLDLPVEDVISREFQKKGSRFSASGSIFGVSLAGNTAISSGIPDSMSVFFRNGAAFTAEGGAQIIARYVEKPLQSGYASDESLIANTGALVDVPFGEGRVILFGFRPQHRGQTLGTFKLLFNSVLLSRLP